MQGPLENYRRSSAFGSGRCVSSALSAEICRQFLIVRVCYTFYVLSPLSLRDAQGKWNNIYDVEIYDRSRTFTSP